MLQTCFRSMRTTNSPPSLASSCSIVTERGVDLRRGHESGRLPPRKTYAARRGGRLGDRPEGRVPAGSSRAQARGLAGVPFAPEGPVRSLRLRKVARISKMAGIFSRCGSSIAIAPCIMIVRPDQYIADVLPLDA